MPAPRDATNLRELAGADNADRGVSQLVVVSWEVWHVHSRGQDTHEGEGHMAGRARKGAGAAEAAPHLQVRAVVVILHVRYAQLFPGRLGCARALDGIPGFREMPFRQLSLHRYGTLVSRRIHCNTSNTCISGSDSVIGGIRSDELSSSIAIDIELSGAIPSELSCLVVDRIYAVHFKLSGMQTLSTCCLHCQTQYLKNIQGEM